MSDQPPVKDDHHSKSGMLHRLTSRRNITVLIAVSLFFIVFAVLGVVLYLSKRAGPRVDLIAPTSLEELASKFPQLSNVLRDDKLDSVYKQFLVTYQQGGEGAAYELAKKRGMLNANEEVRMTLELDTSDTKDLQASLQSHGIKITAVSENLIDIAIPVEVLRASLESGSPGAVFMDISGLEHIIRIRLPVQAIEDVGSVETEGVAVIGADVWQAAGITGKGVKIGVLDVGFDNYKNLLGSDLPANVVAESFIHGVEIDQAGTVHGSAVSEIIHDIAPDAELYLASYQTPAEKQAAVDWLMSQDVDMISSSTGSIFGRRDGKGPLAEMVDEVVAQDVLWVNSSGNTGYTHYRGKFTDTDGDGYHEFAPNDEYMGFSPSGAASLALNWDDWDNVTEDFDMYVLDGDGNEIASSSDTQSGSGSDSGEFIYYEFPDEGPYYMSIFANHVDREVTFDFFLRDGLIEYYNPEYSVNTPGDSNSALTVGAVNWKSGALEDYSSRGPTEDGRVKPDIVAPSGVTSAAYGEPWDGTSASCPHVSGAAALIMQAFPDFTAQQVKEYLLDHAVDMESGGPDSDTGFGSLVLGDPPSLTNVEAPPVSTKPTPEPIPTETSAAAPTETSRPTATPELEQKPTAPSDQTDSFLITLVLIGCVLIPGIIGVGGIGLLGAVLYVRRRRSKEEWHPVDRRDIDLPDRPVAGPAPLQPEIEASAPTIKCFNCGKLNKPGTRFCTNCGTDLRPGESPAVAGPAFCSNCGNPLRPNAKFCPKCGTPVKRAR